MSKVTIKQHDITDCGAACLASVSAHYNFEIPLSRIRQYACTDKKGTNVLGLLEAAKKLGFEAKGVRGDLRILTVLRICRGPGRAQGSRRAPATPRGGPHYGPGPLQGLTRA